MTDVEADRAMGGHWMGLLSDLTRGGSCVGCEGTAATTIERWGSDFAATACEGAGTETGATTMASADGFDNIE